MSRFYVYEIADGHLRAINTVSYDDSLPDTMAEKELTPASSLHTVWNEKTLTLDSNGSDRYLSAAQFYGRFTDAQRFEYHGSVEINRVKNAVGIYISLARNLWLDHAEFDSLFLDDMVSASDMPSFIAESKAAIKA